MSSNNRVLVPVHPHVGPPLTSQQILASNIKYVFAPTGQELKGPVYFNDIRPDGKPYHGGVIVGDTIAYHGIPKNK